MSSLLGPSAYIKVCWIEVENEEFVRREIQNYFNHWAAECTGNCVLHESPIKKRYLHVIIESETGKEGVKRNT